MHVVDSLFLEHRRDRTCSFVAFQTLITCGVRPWGSFPVYLARKAKSSPVKSRVISFIHQILLISIRGHCRHLTAQSRLLRLSKRTLGRDLAGVKESDKKDDR